MPLCWCPALLCCRGIAHQTRSGGGGLHASAHMHPVQLGNLGPCFFPDAAKLRPTHETPIPQRTALVASLLLLVLSTRARIRLHGDDGAALWLSSVFKPPARSWIGVAFFLWRAHMYEGSGREFANWASDSLPLALQDIGTACTRAAALPGRACCAPTATTKHIPMRLI